MAEAAGSVARYNVAGASSAVSQMVEAAPDTATLKAAVMEATASSISIAMDLMPDTVELRAAAMETVPEGICHAARVTSEAGSWMAGLTAETVLLVVTWL